MEKGISKIDDEFIKRVEEEMANQQSRKRSQEKIKGFLTDLEAWHFYELQLVVQPHPCFSEFEVETIGSSSEGLSISENTEAGENDELDFTLILKSLRASENPENYVKEHVARLIYSYEYPGHACLKLNDAGTAELFGNFCNIFSDITGTVNEFYIAPDAVTDELYLMMSYRYCVENLRRTRKYLNGKIIKKLTNLVDHELNAKITAILGEDLLGTESQAADMFYIMYCQEGPAFKTTLLVCEHPDSVKSLQYDCAFAVRCMEWPAVAEEWVCRKRKCGWPPQDLIDEIRNDGCLIVPKAPARSKTKLEWRLSFCLAERRMIESLSQYQKLSYLFLKGIWRKFLKPPIGKALQSYHLKNVLLWECEEIPADGWSRDTLTDRIFGLLLRLKSFVESGRCPHYIIPENNLFQDIDSNVLCRTTERIETCLQKANVVWIKNTGLFMLCPEQTRLGMKVQMSLLYIDLIERICRASAEYFTNLAATLFDIQVIDKNKDAELIKTLQTFIGKRRTKLIIDILNSVPKPNPVSVVKRYVCSRAPPKQLLVHAHAGILDYICSSVSALNVWTELTELVTKLDILKSQNLTEFGFPQTFTSTESEMLVKKFILEWTLDNGEALSTNLELIMWAESVDLEDDDILDEISDYNSDEEYIDISEDEFYCNTCGINIEGVRYNCKECEDFDLCEQCFEANISHSHEFKSVFS